MRRFTFVIALTVAAVTAAVAQTTATTSDGKTVLLTDDGTLTYAPTTTPPGETDFRKTSWGMSSSRVKALEASQPVHEQDGMLVFTGTISSLETYIGYFFTSDMLTRARYLISKNHANKNDYITDFDVLKAQLIKKYGKPTEDETKWKNSLFKDHPGEWGHAISQGDLAYRAIWATPRTRIVLALFAQDYDISLALDYISTDLGHIEETQDLLNF